jgi:protein tyrosine phosphatase (PTP) superfamily phosphohydrolase (DUF442 family)
VSRIPRLLRVPLVVVGGWLALFAVVNVAIVVAGVAARWAGKDPQTHDRGWPDVGHLRVVDDQIAFGAQPSIEQYRELVDQGVTTVIDVRENSPRPDLPGRDDPVALAELGLDYHAIPMVDGQAPSPGEIRAFLDVVDGAEGRVFAHCSGGVGRSTSLAAAYQASRGQDPSVAEQVAVGPPTLEQIWFVGTLSPGEPEHRISPVVAVASRAIDAPRELWGFVTSLF